MFLSCFTNSPQSGHVHFTARSPMLDDRNEARDEGLLNYSIFRTVPQVRTAGRLPWQVVTAKRTHRRTFGERFPESHWTKPFPPS